MGGVINYYHGEFGVVLERRRTLEGYDPVEVLRLADNPHREFGFDYGADIGIDPILQVGDPAVYVRVDPYTGIWLPHGSHFFPELGAAIDRVRDQRERVQYQLRRTLKAPGLVKIRQRGIWAEQYVSDYAQRKTESTPHFDLPATNLSFFLSFSSENVLLARQIFDDLTLDARVEVWFDLAQSLESLEHEGHIEQWLRNAVHHQRGFILLWTSAAARSQWVRRETDWAMEKATSDPDFRFILVKLDETEIPPLDAHTALVDCHNLWPVHGVTEELFAAATARPGRTFWLEEHRRRGLLIEADEGAAGYEPFRSDSGVAVSLDSWDDAGELCWELQYRKGPQRRIVMGRGRSNPVDLGICSGDYIGFFVCHRAALVRYWPGTSLWMRSDDLQLDPGDVITAYSNRSALLRYSNKLALPRKRVDRGALATEAARGWLGVEQHEQPGQIGEEFRDHPK